MRSYICIGRNRTIIAVTEAVMEDMCAVALRSREFMSDWRCEARDPEGVLRCSREPDHSGPHIALLTRHDVMALWSAHVSSDVDGYLGSVMELVLESLAREKEKLRVKSDEEFWDDLLGKEGRKQ